MAPLALSPLPFLLASSHSPNLMLYLFLCAIGLFQHLHFLHSFTLFHSAFCTLLWKGCKRGFYRLYFVYKPGLSIFKPTLNPPVSFSATCSLQYSYCLHLATPNPTPCSHYPSHPSPSSCFLIGFPKPRLNHRRCQFQGFLHFVCVPCMHMCVLVQMCPSVD